MLVRSGKISGNHNSPPSARIGNPRGNNSHSVPVTASNSTHPSGAGRDTTAQGSTLAQISPWPSQAINKAATSRSGGTNTTSKASDDTNQQTTKMATALASWEFYDTCWNSNSRAGASASVTAPCTVTQARSLSVCPTRPNVAHKIAAMAPNDSQKPADNTAHGSISKTTNRAHVRAEHGRGSRRPQNASASTPSMNRVRCAGT